MNSSRPGRLEINEYLIFWDMVVGFFLLNKEIQTKSQCLAEEKCAMTCVL